MTCEALCVSWTRKGLISLMHGVTMKTCTVVCLTSQCHYVQRVDQLNLSISWVKSALCVCRCSPSHYEVRSLSRGGLLVIKLLIYGSKTKTFSFSSLKLIQYVRLCLLYRLRSTRKLNEHQLACSELPFHWNREENNMTFERNMRLCELHLR